MRSDLVAQIVAAVVIVAIGLVLAIGYFGGK